MWVSSDLHLQLCKTQSLCMSQIWKDSTSFYQFVLYHAKSTAKATNWAHNLSRSQSFLSGSMTKATKATKAPVWGKSRMRMQTQNFGAAGGERVHATEELTKLQKFQKLQKPLWHFSTAASQDLDQTNSPAEQHLRRNKGQRTWWKWFDGTCPGDTVDKEQQA